MWVLCEPCSWRQMLAKQRCGGAGCQNRRWGLRLWRLRRVGGGGKAPGISFVSVSPDRT